MLFGECWLEGELAVLTAPAGMGKSLLAVQIAESIARGAAIEPFALSSKQQSVLYIDLKLADKQFEMRYAREYEPEQGEFLKRHYRFSDRFHRVEIDINRPLPEGCSSFAEVLPPIIKKLVARTHAKVVVIDDITCLRTSVYGYQETPPLMRELKRLQRELGLSILVLASDPGRDVSRTPTSLRLLDRFADNVFTIGRSTDDTGYRYIKHIRSQSTDVIHDATHVAAFVIKRLDDNFLGFDVCECLAEKALKNIRNEPDWPLVKKVKELADQEKSIRQIADELNLPKTKVHRMLQLWEPEEEAAVAVAVAGGAGAVAVKDKPTDKYYFPGREEYNEALAHPRFYPMYNDDSPEDWALRREYCNIDDARYEARKEWLETGKAPKLAEALARRVEKRAAAEAAAAAGAGQEVASGNETELLDMGLKRVKYNGREIFVEKEFDNGKPRIWYDFDQRGRKLRKEHCGFGVTVTRV